MCAGWNYRPLQSIRVPKMAEIICERCGSKHLTKAASRMTVGRGRVKRWQCQDCGHYMTEGANEVTYNTHNEYTVVNI